MGTILHKALIITGEKSHIEKEILPIIKERDLFNSLDMVHKDAEIFLNTPGILLIPSSGSKEGWGVSNAFNNLNKNIIKKAKDCGLNYCYVRLGGDDSVFDIRQGLDFFEFEKDKKKPIFIEDLFDAQMDEFEEKSILSTYVNNKTKIGPKIKSESFEENGCSLLDELSNLEAESHLTGALDSDMASKKAFNSWLMDVPEKSKKKRLHLISAGICNLSVDSDIDEIPSNWLNLEKMLMFIGQNTQTNLSFMITPSIINGYKTALFSIDYPSTENIKKFNHVSNQSQQSSNVTTGLISSLLNDDSSWTSIECVLKSAGAANFFGKNVSQNKLINVKPTDNVIDCGHNLACSIGGNDKLNIIDDNLENISGEEKELTLFKSLLLYSIFKNSICPNQSYEMQDDWLLLEENESGDMSIVCASVYEAENTKKLQEKLNVFIEQQLLDLVASKAIKVVRKNRL